MKRKTDLVITGRDPFSQSGIVNPAVYHASTILFKSLAHMEQRESDRSEAADRMRYGRYGTPTLLALEEALCTLEQADGCRALPSGLGAITLTVLAFAEAGTHMLFSDSVYGPTRKLANGLLKRCGVECEFYDPTIGAGIEKLVRPTTRLIFMESPGSLTFEVIDVPAVCEVAKRHNIPTAIDNTWSGGYYFHPLAIGVDVSIQAGTKYVTGHSDTMLGFCCYADRSVGGVSIMERMEQTWHDIGMPPGPDVAYMGQRGLRTMAVRIEAHQAAAFKVAHYLEAHPAVKQVLHPGLESHPQHAIWKRDFTGASGLFSFILKDDLSREKLAAFVDNMVLFHMGYSWGGYESLIIPFDPCPVRTVTEADQSGQAFRLNIGLEDVDDLIEDLRQGIARATGITA